MEGISMTLLSEDPTYLAVGLLILVVSFVTALRVTQQGKYLVLACVSCALAVLTVTVEQLWVTDDERIEKVVYDLGDAVRQSNPDAVLTHLAPNVQYSKEDTALSPDDTRKLVRTNIGLFHFDLLRIGHLRTHVSEQSRRGTAEFQVIARAASNRATGIVDSGSAITSWSLGFQETGPGVWKVSRISPVSIPADVLASTGGLPRADHLRLGFEHANSAVRGPGRPMQINRGRRSPRFPHGPHMVAPADIEGPHHGPPADIE
jgi:hypothetical protein